MRLIDAEMLKENIPNTNVDIFENCRNCSTLTDWQVKELIDKMPTIDAIPIGYIMQRADALKETDEYGARVLYGLIMIWNGEEQNDEQI